ncbi:GTPase [Eoetvoesiella caeni]|uniref:GTP-binding protein Era n=1 Tax=Eoetvoesiella caeni TaxID=645616 RepID=A0A366GZU2_9BURK|nr:GTPase [Eoetvoesiella caeni]MCI2811238.1 50S ribosome-binding GTPase [Eoetvoesiella caeni]NYT57112.1 50S ribosome-binding GTPase [Eoetvoesiella caeni]RBP34100.1 GTP-binding protein Era [Eoetvoesiella caeni]
MTEQEQFDERFNSEYEKKQPNYDEHVNIALVGKVSSGKSSFLNAILGCDRSDPVAKVSPESGATTEPTPYKLDENVLIVDCPGLDDINEKNVKEAENFLNSIDIGIFVVTGSADKSQKANYDNLAKHCKKIILVLNKIDEWDDLEDSALEDVQRQWKVALGADNIFGCCTKGYDPRLRANAPMDLRGIDKIRDEIFRFLEQEKKAILFAKHLRNKSAYANKIILAALAAVAAEAFIPGSTAYITATQVVAISSLNYLYTGEILSKSTALGLLPRFVGQALGANAYIFAKSFLPPNGVLDLAAAVIAVTITFAMLAAIKWAFENNHGLNDTDFLKKSFNDFRSRGNQELKNCSLSDFTDTERLMSIFTRLLSAK